MRIIVAASTFPSSESDHVPAFVRDQIVAMKAEDSNLHFTVLAPHDKRSRTQSYTSHSAYEEYRFHYLWPRRWEVLAGRGILPALQKNPLNFMAIPFLFLGEFYALFRLTHKHNPDVLYAHWFTPQAITAWIVGKLTDTPFVFTTHASDVSVWSKVPFLGTWVVNRCTRAARSFSAVSTRTLDKLSAFFDEDNWNNISSRAKIIPMGITMPSSYHHEPTNIPEILFIGRLAEKKGVQFLLPAFSQLLSSGVSAKLIIAGDGPMLEELKAQSEQLGITSEVNFVGYTTGSQKSKYLQQSNIYVVPSIITSKGDAEGMPVSLLEGLSYGRICIATNESGADGIISPGVNGYLVSQQDSDELFTSLKRALSLSDSERNTIQHNARELAKQFSWSAVARQHIDHLFLQKEKVK